MTPKLTPSPRRSLTPGGNFAEKNFGAARFPYFAQGRQISICAAKVVARSKVAAAPDVAIAPGATLAGASTADWSGQQEPGMWTVGTNTDPKSIEDVFVILAYTI